MSQTSEQFVNAVAELAAVIEERKNASPEDSYTAKLLSGGEDSLLKKLVEEASEATLAAKAGDEKQLVREIADLWFHCFVVMSRYNVSLDDVARVLNERRGVSGLVEKASRPPSGGE